MFTIITPTYNRGGRSNAQIFKNWDAIQKTALAQGLPVQLCIIDDGSDDETFAQLSSTFSNMDNVNLIQRPKNEGPGLARQAGIDASTGKWIWCLDDDDDLIAEELPSLFALLLSSQSDLIAHSLQANYQRLKPNRLGTNIARKALMFREKQEVFNFVFTRQLISQNSIQFTSGVHEDIRYVAEICSAATHATWLDKKLIEKNTSNDSITLGLSERRISGYLQAYSEITASKIIQSSDALLIQYVGLILYLISKETADRKAVEYLAKLKAELTQLGLCDELAVQVKYFNEKNTNFEYSAAIFNTQISALNSQTITDIKAVFASHITCQDLQSSLFLGPDEIRACCKRFFVDGKQKGDVVLLKAAPEISYEDIELAKNDLVQRLNCGAAPECSDCPYIERRTPETSKISYVSLENFSYCNMRCTYCSPTYYGGQEASYSTPDILESLINNSAHLADHCHVVWGGGEPTLSPHFKPVNALLSTHNNISKIRVLSNSLKFSSALKDYLQHDKFHLVTSIDAGTQDMFETIRGRGQLHKVLKNLADYKTNLPHNKRLTVKYILTPENCISQELAAYVEQIRAFKLTDCLFQISCDFRLTAGDARLLKAMYELSARLFDIGVQHVFFDDHIRDRCKIDAQILSDILHHISDVGLKTEPILSQHSTQKIVLWGVGRQAEWMLENTTAGQSGLIAGVARNAADWQAICERHGDNLPILPSGVQSMFEIVRNIKSAGLEKHILPAVLA